MTASLIRSLDGKKSYRRRRQEEERDEREPKTTRRKRTKDNETEERRDERVLLDRVVDRLGGLSWWPSGRPVLDPPKTLEMSPGPARTQNRPILNRICIEKYTDFDGRRIREFCPSRTRPDLVLFRVLGGTDFRVGFLGVFVSRIRFVEDTSKRMCPKPTSGRFP